MPAITAYQATIFLGMLLSYATFYVVVPLIPSLAKTYHVPTYEIWQLATVYEGGKAVGLLLVGVLTTRFAAINVTVAFTLAHTVLSVITAVELELWPDRSAASLCVLFFMFCFIAAASMGAQLGLSLLRETTSSGQEFRRLAAVQGVFANVVIAFTPLASDQLSVVMGSVASPFVIMAVLSGVCVVLFVILKPKGDRVSKSKLDGRLIIDQEDEEEEARDLESGSTSAAAPTIADVKKAEKQSLLPPTPPNMKVPFTPLPSTDDMYPDITPEHERPESYPARVWFLLTSPIYTQYRCNLLLLGVSTSSQYVLPLIVTVDVVAMGVERTKAAWILLGMFVPNIITRMIPIVRPSTSRIGLVEASVWMMFLGSTLMLCVLVFFPLSSIGVHAPALPPDYWIAVAVALPGCLVMAGIGANMANCKAAAVMCVEPWIAVTANSVLKFVQLLFVCVVQFSAGMLAGDKPSLRTHAVLLVAVHFFGVLCFVMATNDKSLTAPAPEVAKEQNQQAGKTPVKNGW